jgi:hypothetical protein
MGLVGCSSQYAGLGAARLGHGGRRQFACRTGALGQVNYRQGGRSRQLPSGGIRGSERQLGRLTRIEPVGAAWRQEHRKGRATSLQALRERLRARRQKEARGLGAWLKFWVNRCMGLARRQALSPRAEVIADGDRLSCWLVSQSLGLEDTRRGSRPRQRSGPRPSGSESEAAEPAMGGPRVAVKIREWPSMGARPFSPCAREIHEPLRLAIAGASSRRLLQL